jgi:methyl-accepting chemotaxis protein
MNPKTRVATAVSSGDAESSVAEISAAIRARLGDEEPKLVMFFGSTRQPLDRIASFAAKEFPMSTLLGASTAGEFIEHGDHKGSVVGFALAGDFHAHSGMGTGLGADPEGAIRQALEGIPRTVYGYDFCTAILLIDPLAGNGEEATLIAAELLGPDVRLAGGAAGDDLAMKQTWVSRGGVARTDAVVIALLFSKMPLGVGVCHGHIPLSEPLRVTRAEGAVIHQIDGRPAWDVWLEQTREAARQQGVALGPSTEGAYLLRYEAGLEVGGDFKIRAPLSRDANGSVSFACGVPEGAVIRIMQSEPAMQIASARQAASRARDRLGGRPLAGALVFDCICRNLILGSEFARAVRGISLELGDVPIAGFETYGEIALNSGDMSGFHNTTTVVLAFPA